MKGRHLLKPIQIQTPERLQQMREKLLEVENMQQYPVNSAIYTFNTEFLVSGTFTSNSASTIHYLFRQQPYASAVIDLQNGRFDVADRMFHSYDCMYKLIFEQLHKEHIQNMLYSMKMYLNLNQFDVGRRQNGEDVQDLSFEGFQLQK